MDDPDEDDPDEDDPDEDDLDENDKDDDLVGVPVPGLRPVHQFPPHPWLRVAPQGTVPTSSLYVILSLGSQLPSYYFFAALRSSRRTKVICLSVCSQTMTDMFVLVC